MSSPAEVVGECRAASSSSRRTSHRLGKGSPLETGAGPRSPTLAVWRRFTATSAPARGAAGSRAGPGAHRWWASPYALGLAGCGRTVPDGTFAAGCAQCGTGQCRRCTPSTASRRTQPHRGRIQRRRALPRRIRRDRRQRRAVLLVTGACTGPTAAVRLSPCRRRRDAPPPGRSRCQGPPGAAGQRRLGVGCPSSPTGRSR